MKKLMIREIFDFGKKSGLNSFEQVKNIHLEHIPFMEKKILTNTMKLQRYEAKTVYKAVIEQLYKEGELPVK
jgi:long-chain acyl-CoA synthetase